MHVIFRSSLEFQQRLISVKDEVPKFIESSSVQIKKKVSTITTGKSKKLQIQYIVRILELVHQKLFGILD